MDAQLKAKWIEALRSGKYPQTSGVLHRPDQGYCCLGVLCTELGATFVKDEKTHEWWPHLDGERLDVGNQDEYLGTKALQRAGLTNKQQITLAEMNDEGASFLQIADHIEAKL